MRRFETLHEQQQRFIVVKTKMKKLLDNCLEKELQYNVNPENFGLSIYRINREGDFLFNHDCYYFGDLDNYKNESTIPLDELIKKVKDYHPLK